MSKRSMSQDHKDKISTAQKARWAALKEEWEISNAELEAMGEPLMTFREFSQMLPTRSLDKKTTKKKVLSEAHKAKLREIAIKGNYAKRLKPYQYKMQFVTQEAKEKAAIEKKARAVERAFVNAENMAVARSVVAGVYGAAIQMEVSNKLGAVDRANKKEVVQVVNHLVEIGFLVSPTRPLSTASRAKMSTSAKRRHTRERAKV